MVDDEQATLARRLTSALERRAEPGTLPLHAPKTLPSRCATSAAPPASTAVPVMESVAVSIAPHHHQRQRHVHQGPPPQGLHGASMSPAAAAFAPHAAQDRLKVLVNSGGRVERGGGEGAWSYVGGETRLVALRAGCSFRQMMSQLGVFAPGGTQVRRHPSSQPVVFHPHAMLPQQQTPRFSYTYTHTCRPHTQAPLF